jgi:DNA-binding NarL/FixJ family response regulator
MDDEIRLLIADDHPLIRHGLRQCIQEEPDLKIVAEAGDGQTALKLIRELKPQIAILDIGMPQLDGFGVAREVLKENLPSKLIFLTAHREEAIFTKALDLGVAGYVLKESVMSDIVSSIRTVAAGQHYVSPVLTSFLVTRSQRTANQPPGLQDLTPAERRIFKLIAENKSSKEIAAELFISYYTVETHRKNICDKLDLHGGYALMKFALEHKTELT